MSFKKQLFTVLVFTKLSTRRFFRDRLALFFGILFPLIFLGVFGALSRGNGNVTFNIAVINESHSQFATQFEQGLKSSKTFKVSKTVTNFDDAKEKMVRSQLDGTLVLPSNFGETKAGVPT